MHEVRVNGVEKSEEARFSKKNVEAQIWARRGQNGPKKRFSAIFFIEIHRIMLKLHMTTGSGDDI